MYDNYNEPVIEELYSNDFIKEEYIVHLCKNCSYEDEELIKLSCPKCGNPLLMYKDGVCSDEPIVIKKAYRHTVDDSEAVHKVYCDKCSYEGRVGHRHLKCPRCKKNLIAPCEVEDIHCYRVKDMVSGINPGGGYL